VVGVVICELRGDDLAGRPAQRAQRLPAQLVGSPAPPGTESVPSPSGDLARKAGARGDVRTGGQRISLRAPEESRPRPQM
jgi:hypothetical protein